MKNIKTAFVFSFGMLFFMAGISAARTVDALPVVHCIRSKNLYPYRSKLGGNEIDFLINKAGFGHMRSVDFSSIFKEPELSFDTHVPQWVHQKKLLSSAVKKDSFFSIQNCGEFFFVAAVVGVGIYGGYHFYKNLKAKKKCVL